MKPWDSRFSRNRIAISFLLLAAIVVVVAVLLSKTKSEKPILYKGKPLAEWFYGNRTNFFFEPTRRAAQTALDDLGTNALPFLLGNLKERRGNGNLYFRAYRAMPSWARAHLAYPLLDDDIKSITLDHIRKMQWLLLERDDLLADCIVNFSNPRVKMWGISLMHNYRTLSSINMFRKLLDDPHPGIRLEAAIFLAEWASESEARDPRLFSILIVGLENKKMRDAMVNIRNYSYQKQPPGGTGTMMPFSSRVGNTDDNERRRIQSALNSIDRHLTPEQKERLAQVESNLSQTDASNHP